MKVYKVQKNSDFRIIYNRGKSYSNSLFVMYVNRNYKLSSKSRLGISVSKKVGKSVTRNRVRRLVYEIYRLNVNKIKVGYDIVFIARVNSKNKEYVDVEKSILNLLKKGSLINNEEK